MAQNFKRWGGMKAVIKSFGRREAVRKDGAHHKQLLVVVEVGPLI
jgi:hypothetical protein